VTPAEPDRNRRASRGRRAGGRAPWAFALVLSGFQTVCLVAQMVRNAPCADELGHLPSSIASARTLEPGFYRVNPPLSRWITGAVVDVVFRTELPPLAMLWHVLWCCNPLLLGHGWLLMCDSLSMCSSAWLVLAITRYRLSPAASWLPVACCWAAAFLIKFTLVISFAVYALMEGIRPRSWAGIVGLAKQLAVIWLIVCSGYPSYVAGVVYPDGVWWYYLFGLIAKTSVTSLAIIIATLCSIGALAVGSRRNPMAAPDPMPGFRKLEVEFGLYFLAVLCVLTLRSSMAINVRYLAPALPFLMFVCCSVLCRAMISFEIRPRPIHAWLFAGIANRICRRWTMQGKRAGMLVDSRLPPNRLHPVGVTLDSVAVDVLVRNRITAPSQPTEPNFHVLYGRGLAAQAPWSTVNGWRMKPLRNAAARLGKYPPDQQITPVLAIYHFRLNQNDMKTVLDSEQRMANR